MHAIKLTVLWAIHCHLILCRSLTPLPFEFNKESAKSINSYCSQNSVNITVGVGGVIFGKASPRPCLNMLPL